MAVSMISPPEAEIKIKLVKVMVRMQPQSSTVFTLEVMFENSLKLT